MAAKVFYHVCIEICFLVIPPEHVIDEVTLSGVLKKGCICQVSYRWEFDPADLFLIEDCERRYGKGFLQGNITVRCTIECCALMNMWLKVFPRITSVHVSNVILYGFWKHVYTATCGQCSFHKDFKSMCTHVQVLNVMCEYPLLKSSCTSVHVGGFYSLICLQLRVVEGPHILRIGPFEPFETTKYCIVLTFVAHMKHIISRTP